MQHECKALRLQVLEEERTVCILLNGGVKHTCSHRRQFVALEQQVVEAESARLAEEEEVDHGVEE